MQFLCYHSIRLAYKCVTIIRTDMLISNINPNHNCNNEKGIYTNTGKRYWPPIRYGLV